MTTGYTGVGKYLLQTGSTVQTAPTSALGVANKSYVDGAAGGSGIAAIAINNDAATTTPQNLAGTYVAGDNATVPSTLTKATNGAITAETTAIDQAASLVLGSNVLLTGQTSAAQNGLYTVTVLGSGAAPWVLTRTSGYDNPLGGLVTGLIEGKRVDLRNSSVAVGARVIWQLESFSTFAAAQIWAPVFDVLNVPRQGGQETSGTSRGYTIAQSGAISLKNQTVLLNPSGATGTGMAGSASFSLPAAVGVSVARDYEGCQFTLVNIQDDIYLPGQLYIGNSPSDSGASVNGKVAKIDLGAGLISHTNGTPSSAHRYLYIGPTRYATIVSTGTNWMLLNYSPDGNVQTWDT